jgi:hypothetical protein
MIGQLPVAAPKFPADNDTLIVADESAFASFIQTPDWQSQRISVYFINTFTEILY